MEEQVRRDLAAQVATERKRRNWTQAQLAERAGVSLGTVSNMERGRVPQKNNLLAVLAALGIHAPEMPRREKWSPDVRIALDVIGLYLESLDQAERDEIIETITHAVMGRNLGKNDAV